MNLIDTLGSDDATDEALPDCAVGASGSLQPITGASPFTVAAFGRLSCKVTLRSVHSGALVGTATLSEGGDGIVSKQVPVTRLMADGGCSKLVYGAAASELVPEGVLYAAGSGSWTEEDVCTAGSKVVRVNIPADAKTDKGCSYPVSLRTATARATGQWCGQFKERPGGVQRCCAGVAWGVAEPQRPLQLALHLLVGGWWAASAEDCPQKRLPAGLCADSCMRVFHLPWCPQVVASAWITPSTDPASPGTFAFAKSEVKVADCSSSKLTATAALAGVSLSKGRALRWVVSIETDPPVSANETFEGETLAVNTTWRQTSEDGLRLNVSGEVSVRGSGSVTKAKVRGGATGGRGTGLARGPGPSSVCTALWQCMPPHRHLSGSSNKVTMDSFSRCSLCETCCHRCLLSPCAVQARAPTASQSCWR